MKKQLINILGRVSSALSAIDGDMHAVDAEKAYAEFKKSRELYYKRDLKAAMSEISSLRLQGSKDDAELVLEIEPMIKQLGQLYSQGNQMGMVELASKIKPLASKLKETGTFHVSLPSLPSEISGEINLDAVELEKCFDSESYRSVTILCGRMLEVALHRKYFDVTGQDILETQPGIGLGKLIAKLKEKNVSFDPGVTEQIHLINQVRISSVHKKSEPFNPTREQAHAMILYTVDILSRLFSRR